MAAEYSGGQAFPHYGFLPRAMRAVNFKEKECMINRMTKRVISVLLVLTLLFSCVPTVFGTDEASRNTHTQSSGTDSSENSLSSSFAPSKMGAESPIGFVSYGLLLFSQSGAATVYEADDIVTFGKPAGQLPFPERKASSLTAGSTQMATSSPQIRTIPSRVM